MSKQDFINAQTHVLSVNFRCKCDGCKRRIKKRLQKIDGVYASAIDEEQGRVSVTGSVEPDVLVQKLRKSGKHAEILSSDKGLSVFKTKKADQFDVVSSLLKNLKMSKGDRKPEEKEGKDQQKDEGGCGKHTKQIAVQQLLQEMKASGDSKPPPVKVKDDDGGEDEAFGDDDNEDNRKKVVQVAGNGDVKVAGKHKKGGGHGGGVMSKMIGKAVGGKIGGKYGNTAKTKGKIGNKGGGGGFPDFEVTTSDNGGGGSGGNKSKIGNKGGGGGGFPDFEVTKHQNGGGGEDGDILPPVQGLAATPVVSNNGGGVGPMGPMSGNSPYQQQPYMGLVNQQGMMSGGDMMHPPGGGYGYGYAPPMPPPAYQDPYTNVFSDENPEGCSVM